MALCYRGLDKGHAIIDRGGFLKVGFELDLEGSAEFGLIRR